MVSSIFIYLRIRSGNISGILRRSGLLGFDSVRSEMIEIQRIANDAATDLGRMRMLNEITARAFPLSDNRLVTLLAKFKPRSWKAFNREQKELCVKATEGKTDEKTLTKAFRIAKRVI